MGQNNKTSSADAAVITSLHFNLTKNKNGQHFTPRQSPSQNRSQNRSGRHKKGQGRSCTPFSTTSLLLLFGTIMSISKCSIGFGVSAFITDIIDPKTLIQTPKHSSATISATRYRRRHGHIHALRQQQQILFGLQMSSKGANSNANAGDGGDEDERRNPKKDLIDNELNGNHNDVKKQNLQSKAAQTQTEKEGHDNNNNNDTTELKSQNEELLRRITQLEALAGSQAVQLRKLREECDSLKDAALAFSQIVELLRQAGLTVDQLSQSKEKKESSTSKTTSIQSKTKKGTKEQTTIYENIDEAEIFGSAPASVSDAADSAGASILAALLGGKHRMLVDVRDAELSRDPDVLVQFIELAILPVAAGLEGLKTQKNRVKIVFPTVSQLMQYRKTMALAAPEVVSLSTLGFDPVEKRDNLVVIIAPSPDDEEGLLQMNELLSSDSIRQPVVVLNHHMVPLSGPGGEFEPIYHLRLLTVQYMAGDTSPGSLESKNSNRGGKAQTLGSNEQDQLKSNVTEEVLESSNTNSSNVNATQSESGTATAYTSLSPEKEDAALAAAMEHAHELGIHQGVTRAMVIRAYPRPWHVFVDTSPDTDADFEVAATFDEYPSQDDINYAIVECLEGSEREDELVAQQMQEAIESGQLNSISDMLGLTNMDNKLGSGEGDGEEDDEDEDDDFYNDWDPWFGADTV